MKRNVRRNIYGNLKGYEGRRMVVEFNGCGIEPYTKSEDRAAKAWLDGRDDWYDAAWED